MSEWQVARHRVAISGRVVDAGTGKPVADAVVSITEMPAALAKRLAIAALAYGEQWKTLPLRPDRIRSREDGLFYFADLPDGAYQLSASLPGYGRRYGTAQEPVKVSHDGKGNLKAGFVILTLPPTAVSGKITGAGRKGGVALAQVRVKGSGERTFSDAQGQYLVAGIEPGKRVLMVSAQGYHAKSQAVTVAEPGSTQTLDFGLTRESG